MIKYIRNKLNEYIYVDENNWIYYIYKYNIFILFFNAIKNYYIAKKNYYIAKK